MVIDDNVNMVENERHLGFSGNETNRETTSVVLLLLSCLDVQSYGCRRKIIDNPVVVVSILDMQTQLCRFLLVKRGLTQNLTVLWGQHIDLVGTALNFVSCDELSQVLRGHLGTTFGFAKGQAVVIFWDLRMN